MAEPQKVDEVANVIVEKVSEAVTVAADQQKEEVTDKVAEVKSSATSFFKHGLTKAGDLVNSAKEFVDSNGVKIEEKIVKVSDSWASLVKGGPSVGGDKKVEEAPLPVSDKSSAVDVGGVIGTREIPGTAEKEPLLVAAPPTTQTSWKNCCGLLDCLKSSE